MGNDYKNSVLKRAKQNRTNRATKSAKEYGKKLSKTQQSYIAGDYISSASTKAYGYKKYGIPDKELRTGGLSYQGYKTKQEGGDPYKATYLYDGVKRSATSKDGNKFTTRKRYLTDDEKKAYKATGSTNVSNYNKNYKQAILRGHDSDGKTFKSNLNWLDENGKMKWDGMKVAKNKVKAGGSKLNYLGGFLKDTIVDPGFDLLKSADRYESAGMGAILGLAENVKTGVDSITNGDFSFKNVDLGRIKKNWNESIDESNKTGWGHTSGHFLKGMSQRDDDARYENILKKQGLEKANKYREAEQKVQKYEDFGLGALGFALDMGNPINLASAVGKTLKGATKGTVQAGKELLTGTADISTAFKKSDDVLDVLTGQGAIFKNKRTRMLDNEYSRVMSKAEDVKQIVKSNPKTQNLGSFLDEIGENIPKGTQRSIDGRTLNKKYTQVKGDYVPQLMRNTDEVVEDVSKNVDNAQINFGQYNSSNINNYFKDLRQTDEGVYIASKLKYASDTGDYSNLIKSLDDIDPKVADRVLDWLEEYEPNVFNKHFGNLADEVDEFAKSSILNPQEINKSYLTSPQKKSKLDVFNNTIEENKKLSSNYDEINKSRLLQDETPIPKRANYSDLKKSFIDYGKNVQEQLSKGDYSFVNKLQDTIKDIDYGKLSKDDNYKMQIIDKLNKELFGTNYIKSNIDKGNLKSFVEHLDDVLNYNLTKQNGAYSFKPKGSYRGTRKGTHYMYDRNGNLNEINLNTSFFSPSLLDENYADKLSFVDKLVGIERKSDLTKPIKALEDKMKSHAYNLLSRKEKAYYDANATESLSNKMIRMGYEKLSPVEQKQYKELTNRLARRDELYSEVSNMNHDEFIAHKNKILKNDEPFGLEDAFEKGLGGDRNKFVDSIEEQRKAKFETTDKSYAGGDLLTDELKQYEQAEKVLNENLKLSESVATSNKFKSEQINKLAKEIGIELPSTKKVVVKLSKNQTITSLPPVQKNFESLKKIVQCEVEEMVKAPATYKTKAQYYSELKKSYVKSLRAYGVPDNAYFKRLTNLKETLLEMQKEVRKGATSTPLDKVVKAKEGGSGTPKNGMNMNLQLLARKIDEMFDELGSKNIDELEKEFKSLNGKQLNIDGRKLNKKRTQTKDGYIPQILRSVDESEDITKNANGSEQLSIFDKLNKNTSVTHLKGSESVSNNPVDKLINNTINTPKNSIDEFVNGFDEFNQKLNAKNVTKSKEASKVTPKKSQKPSTDEIDEILERYKEHGNGAKFDDIDEFNAFRDKLDGKTQKEIDKFIQSNDPSNPSTFEKFKKFFTEKSDNTQIGYEEDGIYKAYKAWLNSWKKGLTIYNPGWHVQNFFQNKGQNYLGLGMDAFGSQKNARNVLAQINGKDKGAYELVSRNGTKYTKKELAELAKKHGVAEGWGTSTSKSHGVFPWLETKVDNSSLMQRALQSEQTARLHHFLTQLERGMTSEEATKSVNKYLFDYGSKSKADKVVSDFVDPFWSFHKNNAKMLLDAPFENGSRVNNLLRADRELRDSVKEEDRVPNSYREHQAPFGSFKDELNGDKYTYHYDENMLPDVEKALPYERDELENKLNPIIRLALQQSRGEGNFGNKIVDKNKADYNEVTKDERALQILKELNPVANPLIKAFSETNRHQAKTDEGKQTQETTNKQILNQWLAYILGNKGNYYRDTRK